MCIRIKWPKTTIQDFKPVMVTKLDFTKLEVMLVDYTEKNKKFFTYKEAMAVQKKMKNGWRLPTRSEWTLICEELGQKKGEVVSEVLAKNLHICFCGYYVESEEIIKCINTRSKYWSSTSSCNTYAYCLDLDKGYRAEVSSLNKDYGLCIRLVRDIKDKG